MSNQLMPGSKKSGEFVAVAGTVVITVTSEVLKYLNLPHVDPVTALSLMGGALVYAALVTIQKVKGVGSESLAQSLAHAAQNGISNIGTQFEKSQVTAVQADQQSVTVAPAAQPSQVQPVQQVYSDSQEAAPIPTNFAPVENVVN